MNGVYKGCMKDGAGDDKKHPAASNHSLAQEE